MESLVTEKPYAAVISQQFVDNYCAYCFKSIDTSSARLACDDCVDVCYCSIKCQRYDWRNVHQLECQILRDQTEQTQLTPTMRLCLRVIIQKLKTDTKNEAAFNGAKFEDLETNFEEFRSSYEHNKFLTDLLAIIQYSSSATFFKDVEISQLVPIICAVLCNSFSVTDEFLGESIGSALYIGIAKHNHSCSSTSHIIFQDNSAILRVEAGTSYSKNIFIPYVSRMLPTYHRQKSIYNVHFFTCLCKLCKDEEKDAIGMARRCTTKNCEGFCKTYDFQENDQNPCSSCSAPPKIGVAETQQATSKLLDSLDRLHKDNDFSNDDYSRQFQHLTKLRNQYSEILADCHVAILQVDEQIAFCLSEMPKSKLPENYEKLAERGCDEYIKRLGLGAPEVTRRLYLAAKCQKNAANQKILEEAKKSSILSHGEQHPLTLEILKMIGK